jgi:hypothetical protein
VADTVDTILWSMSIDIKRIFGGKRGGTLNSTHCFGGKRGERLTDRGNRPIVLVHRSTIFTLSAALFALRLLTSRLNSLPPLSYPISVSDMASPTQYCFFVLMISVAVSGFVAPTHSSHATSTWPRASSPLFSGDKNDNESNEFGSFNPFQPGSKMPSGGGFGILTNDDRKQPSSPTTPGGLVSPRSMRMKELTTDLLACISDDESVSRLLQTNEEFLLEQLNNIDAVLEPDSVFTPSMSRSERYEQYRRVMEERIRNARVPAAKNVLKALMDFVSSKE